MIEQYLIKVIKNNLVENICLESSEDKAHWYFSCYLKNGEGSHEVWLEANSPFTVMEKAIQFISRYLRGCHVGDRKRSKWEAIKKLESEEIKIEDIL